MSSAPPPVPTPRTFEGKKPVPTPRQRHVPKSTGESTVIPPVPVEETPNNNNTFSRKVRSLSSASTQIAEHLGELVQDRKKAVIEGTRQSVRRLTRHFSFSQSSSVTDNEKPKEDDDHFEETIDIFKSIKFESPLTPSSSLYNNIDPELSSSSDSIGLPPPNHPPPPLPEDSLYDAPSSNSSRSYNDYESVFPAYPYSSDSENCIDSTEKTVENRVSLASTKSWQFYDAVARNSETGKFTTVDNIYNNVEEVSIGALPEPNLQPDTVGVGKQVDVNSNVNDGGSSVDVRNSLYENHEILEQAGAGNSRPTQSVLLQFDPLKNCVTDAFNTSTTYDMTLLEELLQGDLYGNISNANTIDNWSISNESETDDFVNPPTPPMRIDSLPDEDTQPNPLPPSHSKSRTSWFTNTNETPKTPTEGRKFSWFKQVKDVLEKAPDVVRGIKNKDNVVQRPLLGIKTLVQKKGMLYKVQNGPVEDLFGEYSGRWCVLENSNFSCFSDNTCDALKEHFPSSSVLSIQLLQDSKYKYRHDNDDLHCFELNTTGKSRGGHIYGSRNISERRVWMQCLAECLTTRFGSKITSDYTRMGWAYVREGVSGEWIGAWVIVRNRELQYAIDNRPVKVMDLRKARCIVLQVYQETDKNPHTNDKGPNMLIDCPGLVLYLRMWTSRETKVWCHIVKLAAHNNGANLDQQQLTKDKVPVIVEKCINFVYAHGSMSEGIYRRAGINSVISDILAKFRKDAFAVQLTTDKYSEFEVATALKRFFRDLPEPLLGSSQRQYLYQLSKQNNPEEKIRMYKAALDQLPPISFNTTKKIIGHLHFISTQSSRNLMGVDNLSAIWGPTLMHYDNKGTTSNDNHQQDARVVGQLITLYRDIFPEDPEELEKEKLMLKVLERCTKSPQGAVNKKTAGDLRIWIYLHNKEGKTHHIAIGPNKTAYNVCEELSSFMKLDVHELVLEEVVLSNRLVRPIHHTEKVLDVVLRWSYWDEPDRKDNHLILSPLSKYWEFIQKEPLPVSSDLKFADNKSRYFKVHLFDFSQAKLGCLKEKTGQTLHTWQIEDIVWYFGHETKRNPQSKWTITFIETAFHPNRTKNSPYFGNILAWSDPTTRAKWLGAMLKARYPTNLTPPPKPMALLDL